MNACVRFSVVRGTHLTTGISRHEYHVNYRTLMMSTDRSRAEYFGKWLGGILRQRNITQTELARQMKKSKGTVGNWVRGERLPSPASCDQLADVLVLPLEHVLAEAGYPVTRSDPGPVTSEAQLVELVRRIDWDTLPGRYEAMLYQLESYLRVDRERRQDD